MKRPDESHAPGRGAAQGGFVLLVVLLSLALLATVALGGALATAVEPLAASALRDRARLRRAAESAAALAAWELSRRLDWSTLPTAGPSSAFTDGAPGTRTIGRRTVDLVAETNSRTCGRSGACDDAAIAVPTATRPWGPENPRWRLFVHLPLAELHTVADAACLCYLVAWVADDIGDADGVPALDAPPGVAGHGVLRVRGAAFDTAGGVAEVETVVTQPCRTSSSPCVGIGVHPWSAVRDRVP